MVVFYSKSPIYKWLYSEFRELCPPEWTDAQAARSYAKTASIDHEAQNDLANHIWLERIQSPHPTGDRNDDWYKAGQNLRDELAEKLVAKLLPPQPTWLRESS
jgi:hypothetical protein